jgi:hypothetical protein
MAIPEDQLERWSNIGAQTTSKDTYATIKACLDAGNYGGKSYCSFLQGSYGNDTNIWKESDVDVVMELTGLYYYDLSSLSAQQQQVWHSAHPAGNYKFNQFKTDVHARLQAQFGADVEQSTKAITIKARGNRRKADVLACFQHKRITSTGLLGDTTVDGICFWKTDGTQVVNYPRLHSQNLTSKHQATNGYYKLAVRIFKNARQKLIDEGVIAIGVAPSYYIEGLLHNIPNRHFGVNYATTTFECLNYLNNANRAAFQCANQQYPLLGGSADVTWNSAHCDAFLSGMIELWNQW